MPKDKLPNAPLQEVIFEVRWALQPNASGKQMIDPEFSFALGKFQDLIKNDFPVKVSKFPNDVPPQILGYQTMYQFWAGKKTWPVVQMGPGILSINDTEKNYIWDDNFYPLIKNVLDNLVKAYGKLEFIQCSLRYIDVVKVSDYGFDKWENFVQSNINFSFENNYNTRGPLKDFQFNQSFSINDLGVLTVNLSSGVSDKNETLFIWQNALTLKSSQSKDSLIHWVEKAHKCTSDVFKELCKEKFYGSFN